MSELALSHAIRDLVAMQQTKGWQLIKTEFAQIAKQLQDEINEPGGNEMKYSEGDLKKLELRMIKSLIETPGMFFEERARRVQRTVKDDDDPFNPKQSGTNNADED